ncbi:MAG TPA: ribosome recycling factor [Dehalococcoidia bacterium]|nr:ribosome recycling factor [Dehalococcoidia bacterium]
MVDDILKEAEREMAKAVETLQRELSTIRTGRASPSLVERVTVDVYGASMPLSQVATITAPEARLLVIQPWDRSSLPAIEKAIQKSDLGLNPASDGSVIRLAIPQLTEDRRKDLVKQVKKKVEEERVVVRNIRRDANEELRRDEKDKKISADEQKRGQDRLQKLTDRYVAELDKVGDQKEAELLTV